MGLLELHRASAGSGKTYTLAKKFLWYFLTVRENADDVSARRLRTEAELRDSARHILAVTFTNKATEEMKQRIIQKLDALAHPSPEYLAGDLSKEPDYMRDFIIAINDLPADLSRKRYAELIAGDTLDIKREDIIAISRKALYILLENYSDFQVSTIDAFFQQVLRTFAYETDLNDSYSLELDSDYLSKVSIDATLQDVEEKKATAQVRSWLDMLMENARSNGYSWNLFQKSNAKYGSYLDFMNSLKKLENEEFKKIRQELEDYFDRTPNLIDIFQELDKKYDAMLKEAWEKMAEPARELNELMKTHFTDEGSRKKFRDHSAKSLGYHYSTKPKLPYSVMKDLRDGAARGKTYMARRNADPAFFDVAEPLYIEMTRRYQEWLGLLDDVEVRHWQLYKKNFPYLGLLKVTLDKRREYLDENNSIELGETNTLLRRIIGEDDTPFIYERLGTRLNHFLIDEFQDTSEMQWDNFKPLLSESLGRGNENLLIGDAKQSIYRFRNADSSLISDKVEQQFAGVELHGNVSSENTNHRSAERVVCFNNGFFRFLTDRLKEEITDEGGTIDFQALYANVEQSVSQKMLEKEEKGYVEIDFFQGSKSANEEIILRKVTETVLELRSRGYLLKDIGILVMKNDQGEAVINEFTRHNSETKDPAERIEFISEQSLKVASSLAVKMIVNTLNAISRGRNPEVRKGEDARKHGVADWNQIASDFRVFALRHPDLSTPEQLSEFFRSGSDTDAISKMLGEMQAVTLPALVEGITATFVPTELRRKDAAFIAAFQDIILDYCDSHPSDIASFLLWWERRGGGASIASPEGMNAVTVMTIHKSKGLELPCVIMPYADVAFNSAGKKEEWRWVKPQVVNLPDAELPPYIPVSATSDMVGTMHEPLYREFLDLNTMDSLNLLYVGFTRAVNELYIFCTTKGETGKLTTDCMLREYLEGDKDQEMLTVGERYKECPVSRRTSPYPTVEMADYPARISSDLLRYKEQDTPSIVDAEDAGPDDMEDNDPRSEGNLLHALMEGIHVPGDVGPAVKRLVRKGLVTKDQGAGMEKFVKESLQLPEVSRWFSAEAKVLRERPILGKGQVSRPDRVVLYPDGTAEVIDYKFGQYAMTRKYCRQVRDYVERLKDTGRFRKVTGYLWFVRAGQIEMIAD